MTQFLNLYRMKRSSPWIRVDTMYERQAADFSMKVIFFHELILIVMWVPVKLMIYNCFKHLHYYFTGLVRRNSQLLLGQGKQK